jgi:hypothetical protein
VVLTLTLLCASLVSPAVAETVHRQDARDDASSAIDIRSVDYTHGPRRVRVVADIPDLGDRGTASLSISRFTIFEAGYVLQIKKRAGSRPRIQLFFFNHFDLEPRNCSQVSGRWGEDRIKLIVARKCLKGHVRNRLFVQFGIQRGQSVDRAPAVRRIQRG